LEAFGLKKNPFFCFTFPCLLVAFWPNPALLCAEEKPNKPMDYPTDVHKDRDVILKQHGPYALDAAYAVWRCAQCGKHAPAAVAPLYGRRPFMDMYEVVRTTARALLSEPLPGPPGPKGERTLFRCPFCATPDFEALPRWILFTHVLPETGDDLRVEFAVNDKRITSETFFRVRTGKPPEKLETPKTEIEFFNRFGVHFSLRAVWRECLLWHAKDKEPQYKQVAPGLWFVFRPLNAPEDALKKLVETKIAEDLKQRKFDLLLSPCRPPTDQRFADAGTWRDWGRERIKELEAGDLECFTGVSVHEVRRITAELLKNAGLLCRWRPGDEATHPGHLTVSRGEFSTAVDLRPILARAVYGALSIHQAAILETAGPLEELGRAEDLSKALRFRFFRCTFAVENGKVLVVTDRNRHTIKADMLRHGLLASPSNREEFDAFCEMIFPWDEQKQNFITERDPRALCHCGLPAFVERRIRPPGFFADRKQPLALFEAQKDADGKPFDLCWTSECFEHSVYVDAVREPFQETTIAELEKIHPRTRGILPYVVEAHELALPPADDKVQTPPVPISLACGNDLASIAIDENAASEAARLLNVPRADGRLHVYAMTTHAAVFSPRALTATELEAAFKRLKTLAESFLSDAGTPLNLHFDLPRVAPKGKVIVR
jgi:hypothetical protein